MKKLVKSFLSIILVFAIVFSAAPLSGFKGVGSSLWKGLCSLAVSAKEGVEEIIENLIPENVSDNTLAASGQCGENVYWTFNSSTGALTISGTGKMYNYSGYESPFYHNLSIKSVTIESGVTSIGDNAFDDCYDLTSIEIPDSVTSIGDYAFTYCYSLTSIDIPASVTSIGDGAFDDCYSLTSVTIGNSVTSIGDEAFLNCYDLTSIEIPDSVTSIGDHAFYHCSSLTSATIGNGVTSIGDHAFFYCSSLTSITVDNNNNNYSSDSFGVLYNKDKTELIQYPIGNTRTSFTIPASVTSIEYGAFTNCETSIKVDKNNNNYSSDSFGDLYNKDKTELIYYHNSYLRTSFTIPDSVTSIGDWAFYDCINLRSVTIPDSVTSIGEYAFAYCWSLTSVTIGNSVTSIGNYAFFYCRSLTSIEIPDSVTSIGEFAFHICSSLRSVTIGNGVTSIGTYAFWNCSSLTSIDIPDSVTSIGKYAFYDCSSLTSIVIPDSVTSIGNSAFAWCSSLTSIEIPNSVTSIGNSTFSGCSSLTSIEIPDSVTSIGSDAFGGCSSLTSIVIPDSVTSIGEEAFYGCSSLTSIVIPDSVTSIGSYAFYNCSKLTSVTIGNSVTSIGYDTFYGCRSLTSITIPNSVMSIDNRAFYYCSSLTSIEIPDSVTSIGGGAFENCSSLTSIEIPDSVTSIGSSAFKGCASLITVNFNANNCTKMGSSGSSSVFYNCTKLTTVVIGEEVDVIPNCAFSGCSSLTSITIPDSVTSIDNRAFYYCSSLKDVYYSGSQEQWKNISIGSYNSSLTNATIQYNSTVTASGDFKNVPVTFVADNKEGRTDVDFRQSWFTNGSSTYNHNLAKLCSQFAMIGYDRVDGKQPNLEKALKDIGMDGIETKPNAGQEEVNYFIANRKITVGSKEYTLIFAGFIGSYHAQWYSNFDPGTGTTHKGFNNAKNYVMGKLKNYVDKLADNYSVPKSKIKFLICGHSRGAATANLVAADLIKNEQYAYKDNIYTYAFATPNSTTSPERKEAQYKRIFNIVNPEDFVTKVMLVGWGYGRYGTTYVLPSITNTKNSNYKTYYNNMQSLYDKYTAGETYTPYATGELATYKVVTQLYWTVPTVSKFYNSKHRAGVFSLSPYDFFHNTLCHFVSKVASSDEMALAYTLIGDTIISSKSSVAFRDILIYFILGGFEHGDFTLDHKFVEAHSAKTYCAYTMSMSKSQMKQERKGYLNAVNCPVDVEVYDKETGELVGRIVNNVVDEEIAAKENAIVMSVDGDSKQFWLPSDGDYEIKFIGNDNGTMDYSVAEINEDSAEVQKVNFFDVPIENGKAYEAEIKEETTLDDYTIESPTGNDVVPTENMKDDEIISCNIEVITEGDGYATNSMTVTSGERVILEAQAEESASFLGWYENGALISTETQLSFVVKSDRNITAKFSEKTLPSVKSVSIGDISLDYKSSAIITPQITTDEGVKYDVSYKSSNPSAVSVDQSGRVTSNKTFGFTPGSAVITVTVTDPSNGNTVTDTCTVTVNFSAIQWIIKIVLFGWIWY